ncbi:hypothetical protein OLMES_2582 [Oleiphilus messinensis]|uniref:Uncharacterized protein n=2 Tax=Oleiphilus messinensis TaxID=141451 RepID=A0A1Y0I808_9GAMM|nr:hypothetical protein OLMES_2582 [Oleiphilus messinensis]
MLLVPEQAYSGVRQTEDIDVILDIMTRSQYYSFCERLRAKGFKEDVSDEAIICRWIAPKTHGKVKVDVMPTSEEILGFTNRWYIEAINTAETIKLPMGIDINVVSAPYFLATKMEAFKSRGKGDYFCHDLEDILFVIENRDNLVIELFEASVELKDYLADEIGKLYSSPDFVNILPGLLTMESSEPTVKNTLSLISRLA